MFESINKELDCYHLRLNNIEGLLNQIVERIETLERKIQDKGL
jgi:hypothetical protein